MRILYGIINFILFFYFKKWPLSSFIPRWAATFRFSKWIPISKCKRSLFPSKVFLSKSFILIRKKKKKKIRRFEYYFLKNSKMSFVESIYIYITRKRDNGFLSSIRRITMGLLLNKKQSKRGYLEILCSITNIIFRSNENSTWISRYIHFGNANSNVVNFPPTLP